jgi:hypothetical protein
LYTEGISVATLPNYIKDGNCRLKLSKPSVHTPGVGIMPGFVFFRKGISWNRFKSGTLTREAADRCKAGWELLNEWYWWRSDYRNDN